MDVPDRLAELEVRMTFLDEAVAGLLRADAERSVRLDLLERTVRELRSELAAVRVALGADTRLEPPPPHY